MRHHSSLGNCLLVPQRSYRPARIHCIPFTVCFYPRDAMLALCLCLSVCLSVCLSQVGVLSKRMDGSSWFLACRLHSTSHTLCCMKIHVSTKVTVLPSGTLSHTPDFKKFCFGISIVETCYRLSSRKVDAQSVINWTVVGQLS